MLRTRAVLQKPEQTIDQSICSAKEAGQNCWGRWFQPLLPVGAIGARKTLQPPWLKRECKVSVRNRRLTFLFPPLHPHFIPEMTGIRESNDSDRSTWDSIAGRK